MEMVRPRRGFERPDPPLNANGRTREIIWSQTESQEVSNSSDDSSGYATINRGEDALSSSDDSNRTSSSTDYASIKPNSSGSDQSSSSTRSSHFQARNNEVRTPFDGNHRPAIYRPNNPVGRIQVSPQSNTTTRTCCSCSRKCVFLLSVVGALACSAAVAVLLFFLLMPTPTEEDACQILTNEVICPYKDDYNRIDILSPSNHLRNGNGRTSYDLDSSTDVTIDGYNIRVHAPMIYVSRKPPNECAEEAENRVIFSGENNSTTHTKLPSKVKDLTEVVEMEITPFINTIDSQEYVQFRCTGYHKCGTIVVDLEVQIPDFGTYSSPMECSRTNIDGTVMDSYGYACTLFMAMETFKRTDSLKCKPTVETLQNTITTSIAQQSVVVNETTRSHYIIEKGEDSTIKFNVNVQSTDDIRYIQTRDNGDFRANEFKSDARVKLSTEIIGHIATCTVDFRPATCIDAGTWRLHLQNDTQDKQIKVIGTSTFKACPPVLNVHVGERIHLNGSYCVPDDVHSYEFDLYGKRNMTGSFQRDKPIQVGDPTSYFHAFLNDNELSIVYRRNVPSTCRDHNKALRISLKTKTGVTKQIISSLTIVKGDNSRYSTHSTGGDFRENNQAVVRLSVHLACRPTNITIHINRKLLTTRYNLTEDPSTGEKIFSKSFSFERITMNDNGSIAEVHISFNDDEGSRRNLNITQDIRVIPDTFCEEKPQGCNYIHPYNSNMWVACGEGVIANLFYCQPGLVFVQSNCKGKCCPVGSADTCG